MFDEDSIQFAKCSFPFATDCEGRDELQRPKPTELCPRQNGYFVHEDPRVQIFLDIYAFKCFLMFKTQCVAIFIDW